MLVEDELVVAMDLRKRLEMLGYQVVGESVSGEEAMRNAEEYRPDLILMDVRIKGKMDGVEAATKIREQFDIPVIFLTAFTDNSTINRTKATGSFGYLVKPVDDRALYPAIESALYKHKMETKLRESEERYAIAVRATHDAIWDWNLNTNQIHYSPRWKTLLGIPEEANIFTPEDWMQRVHPEDFLILSKCINRHLQQLTSTLECEVRMKHADGSYLWMLCRGLALFDAQEKPYRITGSISDITAQKKSFEDERLRRREAELLQRVMIDINSSLDLEEVLNKILLGLEQAIPFESAAICLIEGESVRIATLGGASRLTRAIGEKVVGQEDLFSLMKSKASPVIIGDAETHTNYLKWSNAGKDPFRSWMGLALVAHEHLIGYLMVTSTRPGVFTQEHARLAQAFANQAALAIENANLFDQVRKGRERLQALSKRLVEIQEAERSAIAHEMHDEIGQVLTGLQFILTIGKEGSENDLNHACSEAQTLVSNLITQVRELSINLHPPMLDDLGLLPSLKSHFDRVKQLTGINVNFFHQNMERRFSAEIELSAFRVIQEALTNIARHAGVKEANVNLTFNDQYILIQIEDHGKGFDLDNLKDYEHAFGISGIRERTYLIGGKFEITSKPGEGTRVNAWFPVAKRLERRRDDR